MPQTTTPQITRQERGAWLRQQRRARGWSIPTMARKLRDAARTADDTTPSSGCLTTMIRRWEHEAGSRRTYRLHYTRALNIPPDEFATTPPPPAP